MVDLSIISRKGRISGDVHHAVLGTSPVVFFDLLSSINIGDSIIEETTKILLQGEVATWWESLQPSPGDGAVIRCHACLGYVRDGFLCLRPALIDQLEIEPINNQEQQPGEDPDIIHAAEYFKKEK